MRLSASRPRSAAGQLWPCIIGTRNLCSWLPAGQQIRISPGYGPSSPSSIAIGVAIYSMENLPDAKNPPKMGMKMKNGPRPEMVKKWPSKWKKDPRMGFWPFFQFRRPFLAVLGLGEFTPRAGFTPRSTFSTEGSFGLALLHEQKLRGSFAKGSFRKGARVLISVPSGGGGCI